MTVDRSTLKTLVTPFEEFIEKLIDKIWVIYRPHSFSAHNQAQYLKQCKETLKKHECVVLVDFSENYTFIDQDVVQGYHWTNDQVTLRPVVISMHQDEIPTVPKPVSLCIISYFL